MPTIQAEARYDNIMRSLNVYTQSAIVTGLGVPVYFMGQERFGTLPPKWVESDFIYGGQVSEIDHGPNGTIGAVTECYLNLNVFMVEQVGLQKIGIYAMPTLVTDIVERFDVPVEIPVRDYEAVGTPIVGSLRVWEKPRPQMIGTAPDSGIRQTNVSVLLRYHSFTLL
jgi:hypothetical protein